MGSWKRLGLIYAPEGDKWWAKSHAMIPTPIMLNQDIIRVFITCCDATGVGRVGYVDLASENPKQIIGISELPLFDIGQPGTFDENGALACSAVKHDDGRVFIYYAGFELGTKIRYRLLTGLAISDENGENFKKVKNTPILERSDTELFFRGGPFVLKEQGKYRMWYVAGGEWEQVGDALKPVYDIRYLESEDGIHWPEAGRIVLRVEKENEHGFGRPYIVRNGDDYEIYYSVRRRDLNSYRLGYATSVDGLNWLRNDESLGMDVSAEGWDSEMICYSAVIEAQGQKYMFYNGNNFGQTGFGLAKFQA